MLRSCLFALVAAPALAQDPADALPYQGVAVVAHQTNIEPRRAWPYGLGHFSGPWVSDLRFHDGRWLLGDGFGGLWHSEDATTWERAETFQGDSQRSLQNAPLRSITASGSGTLVAAFLGGGGLRWPRLQSFLGLSAGQRSPLARSRDGQMWDVVDTPESCGFHFPATDGDGHWMAPACGNNILVSDDDGRTWRIRDTELETEVAAHERVEAQGYVNGHWIVGAGRGAEGGIYYSATKEPGSWQRALAFPPRVLPKRSIQLGDVLVMTGSWRFLATSQDGREWTLRHVDGLPAMGFSQLLLAGVHLEGNGYLLGGRPSALMYSPDLERWYDADPGFGLRIVGMARSPDGRIYASASGPQSGIIYRIVMVHDDDHLQALRRDADGARFHYGELRPVLR